MLTTNNLKDEKYLKMDWEERSLFTLNLDYLWKLILFTQEKVCAYNEKQLREKLRFYEQSFNSKNEILVKEIEEKDIQIKKLLAENK